MPGTCQQLTKYELPGLAFLYLHKSSKRENSMLCPFIAPIQNKNGLLKEASATTNLRERSGDFTDSVRSAHNK